MRLELRAHLAAPVCYVLFALLALGLVIAAPHAASRIGFAITFVAILWWSYALARRRVILDERGLTHRGATGTTTIPWSEVDHYRFSSDHLARANALTRLFARNPHRSVSTERLVVLGTSGRQIVIDRRYAHLEDALDLVFEALHAHLRDRATFEPFALADHALVHRTKGRLPLADIERVEVVGAVVLVTKRGKRFSWATESMTKVKNVMLLVERLAERGIVVVANPHLFVPSPVLDKLREAASRQSALPRARVVVRN